MDEEYRSRVLQSLRQQGIPTKAAMVKSFQKQQPSRLPLSILFNLAYFDSEDGWKNRSAIRKTDALFRNKEGTRFLKFTSQFANLHSQLVRLEEYNVIEERDFSYTDKKNRQFSEKQYRLKPRVKSVWTLHAIAGNYDFVHDYIGPSLLDVWFQSDFYKLMPNKLRKEWDNQFKAGISAVLQVDHERLVEKFDRTVRYLKRAATVLRRNGLDVPKVIRLDRGVKNA